MWKSKKFIITVVLTIIVLAGILGGYAVAQADDEENGLSTTDRTSFMDRVAEIYEENTGVAIDSEELKQAFTEAGQAIRGEARDKMLEKLVEDGQITQEQADEYEAWLEARPDFMTDEFKEWLEDMPDIGLPFGSGDEEGGKRFGMFRGFAERFDGGHHSWCEPDTTED